MARVSVRVELDPDIEEKLCNTPQAVEEVNKKATQIAARANAMGEPSGIWHVTGKEHNPDAIGGVWTGNRNSTETIGGTKPYYMAKPAKKSRQGRMVAIVVTENYAAHKDNTKNNTLVRAIG